MPSVIIGYAYRSPLQFNRDADRYPWIRTDPEEPIMGTRKITAADRQIVDALSLHKLATAEQLAALLGRNVVALRRGLRRLEEARLVEAAGQVGRSRGAPATAFGLRNSPGQTGTSRRAGSAAPSKAHFADHTLMTTELAASAASACRDRTGMTIHFHNPAPIRVPTQSAEDPAAPVTDRTLIPDATFTVTRARDAKTLLFFLEADTGSESLTSERTNNSTLADKIIGYQHAFATQAYRAAASSEDVRLRGFRVLLVTEGEQRESALGDLLRALRPTDFIWSTQMSLVAEAGFGGEIWNHVGRAGRDALLGPAG